MRNNLLHLRLRLRLRKFRYILCLLILSATPVFGYANYDVNTPHVIINQIFGGNGGGYVSHSFIELYNPTNGTVDLANWSIHYRSSLEGTKYSDKWYKLNLSGEIPAHCSYLIICNEDKSCTEADREINNYDLAWERWGV